MRALILRKARATARLVQVAGPVAGPGEAVVALRAAALNHRERWIHRRLYPGLRFRRVWAPVVPVLSKAWPSMSTPV
jgi:NADPH:quinone reductase-like Zn-dependent oxidoreductase